MLLKKKNNLFGTFAFRLTLWYAILFILSLIIIFFISYKILAADLVHVVDRDLLAATNKVDQEFHMEGLTQVKSDIRGGIEEEGINREFYRLLTSNLNIVVTSDPLKWPCLNFPILSHWASMAAGGQSSYHTLSPHDRPYKIRILSQVVDDGKYVVQIGKPMKDEEELAKVYSKVFLGSVFILLLCGIILSWIEAQKAMKGVKRITSTAWNIGQGDIKHRVELGHEGEEIEDLAETFNHMLDRIEQLMMGLKDVTNNIAHDLRTPLTRIRGLAESTLGKKDVEGYRESVGTIVEECDRLNGMINTMLEIAEADAGLKKPKEASIDIVALAQQGVETFLPVAEDKGINLEFKGPSHPIIVLANAPRLQRIIANLLDNAIKFTESKGRICLEIKEARNEVIILVKDTGIGIAKDNQARIFEKFYRVESSRSTPGHGLGLSFVKSMVSSMGGSITVESFLNNGTTFTINIPLKSL
jgi:signal transduction histidine kinase